MTSWEEERNEQERGGGGRGGEIEQIYITSVCMLVFMCVCFLLFFAFYNRSKSI